MKNLDYFINQYQIDINQEGTIVVPEVGRVELANLFKDLGFKVGAEIGVQRGEYSVVLGNIIPDLKLYGIDAWTFYDGYRDIRGDQARYDLNYEIAKTNTAFFDCELIKGWSNEAGSDIPDGSLDFVYIDANHDFLHCTQDIAVWEKKVKKGGVISGHDFWRHQYKPIIHVKDAVEGWTKAHEIKPLFAITKDRCPNWMWFK